MDNKNSNVEDDAEAASSERLLEPNQAQNISNSREQGRKLHSKMMLGKRFHALKGFMFGSEDGRKEFRALGQKKEIRLSPCRPGVLFQLHAPPSRGFV